VQTPTVTTLLCYIKRRDIALVNGWLADLHGLVCGIYCALSDFWALVHRTAATNPTSQPFLEYLGPVSI